MKKSLLSLLAIVAFATVNAQIGSLLWQENFASYTNGGLPTQGNWKSTGTPTSVSPAWSFNSNLAATSSAITGLTVSNVSGSKTVSVTGATSLCSGTGTYASIDAISGDYFQFTLTPAAGSVITVSAISFTTSASNSINYNINSSADSYTAQLLSSNGSAGSTCASTTNTLSTAVSSSEAITFRIYRTSSGTNRTWNIDQLSVTMTILNNQVSVKTETNNVNALTYAGYTSGTNYITTAAAAGDEAYRTFTSVNTANTTTFYYTFVLKVTTATATGDMVVSLGNTGNTSFPARFLVRSAAAGSKVNFGISKGGSSTSWSNNMNFNQSYLVAIRYDINSATTSDDNMWMWINPTNLNSEPATGSAAVNITGGTDPSYGTAINALYVHQVSTNGPATNIDAFRIAYAYNGSSTTINSAAAWFNLSPFGAPLPVKYSSIKASQKQNGVQLDWTSYEETNLVNYVIERSADGIHFSSVGTVDILNSGANKNNYSFFDAAPLSGAVFYRIRNNDLDGKSAYSNIVRINLDNTKSDISLYPNPVRGTQVSIQASNLAKAQYQVNVFNVNGQLVYNQQLNHAGGAVNQTIELSANLKSGMYNLQLVNNGSTGIVKPFILVK